MPARLIMLSGEPRSLDSRAAVPTFFVQDRSSRDGCPLSASARAMLLPHTWRTY